MKRIALLISAVVLGSMLTASPARAANLGIQVDTLPSSVRVHSAVYVTGTAPLLRSVVLQVQRGYRWYTISGPSAAGARFSFRLPTGYYGHRIVRVVAPPSGLLGEIDSAVQTVTVHMGYNAQGRASQRVLLNNGYRWNPCEVVPYRVNLAGLPSTNLRIIRSAIRKVTEATGIHYKYAGSTKRVPFNAAWTRSPATSGLFIGFGTPRNVPALKGAAGLGGEGILVTTASGNHVIRSGGVAIHKGWWKKLKAGFVRGPSRGSLLLHEIAHTIGMMHAPSKTQVMYTTLGTWSYGRYGRGDLAGLNRLGLDQGCLP